MKRCRTSSSEIADSQRGHDVLSFNVGGIRFQVSRDTAARIPYFQSFIEGRLNFACHEEGWNFADRCGELFKHLLQFARDAKITSLAE
eukprot:8099814-Karenia_brevis.AAC.1